MNKAIQKMILALAVCGTLCGTAMAAPKHNAPKGGKAPAAMRAEASKAAKAKPAPSHQVAKTPVRGNAQHAAPARHEPKHEVARRHNPSPARPHHEPKHHHHHHNNTLHTEDWCEIGASLLGGLIGGLVGASI